MGAFCPMYVLVLEELERQYRAHSDFFTEDNQCLTDVIMESQANEREANHHEFALATEKNSGYEAGRVARTFALKSMDDQRKKRALDRANAALAAQQAGAGDAQQVTG